VLLLLSKITAVMSAGLYIDMVKEWTGRTVARVGKCVSIEHLPSRQVIRAIFDDVLKDVLTFDYAQASCSCLAQFADISIRISQCCRFQDVHDVDYHGSLHVSFIRMHWRKKI